MDIKKSIFLGINILVLFLLLVKTSVAVPIDSLKPRIVVLTDVSTWETDDSESLVRLFAYADLFEIEGLIYTTGWSLDKTRDDFFGLIHQSIDAYEKDLPNLQRRSGQKKQDGNEEKQKIGYWPSAQYLKSRTVTGSKNRGLKFIGNRNDSPGSELLIKLAKESDSRPLWILAWGGGNTLAQAVWRIKQDGSAKKVDDFLKKIRFYAITDQDREQKTPYDTSAHQWLRKQFEKRIFFIWDESAWLYQNGTGRSDWSRYAANIQNHGNLGSVYPKYKFGVEGDTPSFLYVLPNGLNLPQRPDFGGWGGFFKWELTPDNTTYAYTNHDKSKANETSKKYEQYFYPAIFNDFAARMDWAKDGKGNRNPIVVINKDSTLHPIILHPKKGSKISLDASASYDPEKDHLNFKWWLMSEAGTYQQKVKINGELSSKLTVDVPNDVEGKNFHIICEVTDNGTPQLTSYRRIIVEIKP